MKNGVKGSITLALSLSLTIILAVLGVIIESARETSLNARLQEVSYMAEDAIFSEYIASMYKDYGIMAFYKTTDEITNKFTSLCNYNLNPVSPLSQNYNMLKAKLKSANISEAAYMTDNGAKAFVEQVCEYMKYDIPKEMLSEIIDKASVIGNESQPTNTVWADEGEYEDEDYNRLTSLLDWVMDLVDSGSLLFVTDEENVSTKYISTSNLPSVIAYNEGNNGIGIYEKAMLAQYYSQKFSCFTDEKEDGKKLDYELEYIIAGNDSDKANLASIVRELSLIRQGLDFAYLLTDEEKLSEAHSLALTISVVILNPELEEPIKYLLLALWSYAESQADVKALLSGQKVSLIKTADEWQTGISSIFSFAGTVDAAGGIEGDRGLSYKDYLKIILYMKNATKTVFNALDIIQINIEAKEETPFLISGAITSLSINARFESNMPFASFGFVKRILGKTNGNKYEKTITQSYSY